MKLSFFDYYLLGANLFGFLLFIVYIFFLADDEANWCDTLITIVTFAFGSLGVLISLCIFGRTPREYRKETMMSRIFIWCMVVIQIVLVLIFKGYIKTQITVNIFSFLSEHIGLIIYIVAINIISLLAYAIDKRNAIERRSRIRISVLLFLAFAGGSIGALIAMYAFRHKINIDYFTVGVPLTLIMQIIVIFYLMNMAL